MTDRIIIGLDKFFLDPLMPGSIDYGTYSAFKTQYGNPTPDIINIFRDLFGHTVTKEMRSSRISCLDQAEKEAILHAMNTRLTNLHRSISDFQTLQNTATLNKRRSIEKIRDEIMVTESTEGCARVGQLARPVNEIVDIQEYTPAETNTPEQRQKKMKMRADLFQRILTFAYYLANPSKLEAIDSDMYDRMEKLTAFFNKGNENLTNIVQLIQGISQNTNADPLTYFDYISMPDTLSARSLADISGSIINTDEETRVASLVVKLMGLLKIEREVDSTVINNIERLLRDGTGTFIGDATKKGEAELGVKILTALRPLSTFIRLSYPTLYTYISSWIERADTGSVSMDHITEFLRFSLNKTLEKGIYRIDNVPEDIIHTISGLIKSINYGVSYGSIIQSSVSDRRRLFYLPDNLPIPQTVAQIDITAFQFQKATTKDEFVKNIKDYFASRPNTLYMMVLDKSFDKTPFNTFIIDYPERGLPSKGMKGIKPLALYNKSPPVISKVLKDINKQYAKPISILILMLGGIAVLKKTLRSAVSLSALEDEEE
jgi:hypothetical protein